MRVGPQLENCLGICMYASLNISKPALFLLRVISYVYFVGQCCKIVSGMSCARNLGGVTFQLS